MSDTTSPHTQSPEPESFDTQRSDEQSASTELADPGAPNAGHALVALMAEAGTQAAFGVVSIHNLPLVEALVHDARFVTVRHEAAAVNAADGYSRVSGHLGVAITSTGTGAGNAAGSLVEALTAGSAVLHLTGNIDSEYLGQGRGVIHETKDQRKMLEAVSKATITVTDPDETGDALQTARQIAEAAPRGPVSVEIPIDLQYQATQLSEPLPIAVAAPNPDEIARSVELIEAAERPVLWLGGGATGARRQIEELVARTGAGVLTSNAGRGTLDERDPMVIGNYASAPGCAALLTEADLLISIGTHFRSNETKHYHLDLPTPHLQIDVDAAAIGRTYTADAGVVGDAAEVLDAILDRVSARERSEWRSTVTNTRELVREQQRSDIGPYAAICDAMRSAMHDDSPFVRDVTIPASTWGNRLLPVLSPETNVYARGGGIGQGLAMGLGAAIACPNAPTFVMVGDGGLAVHLGEFGSVAEAQPWLVLVIFNDGGYGVLRNLQDHHFGRRSAVDLATPDFEQLSAAFGIDYRSITDAGQAESVFAEATTLGRPVVVEVDVDAIGPMPKPFVPPVPVPG